MGVGKGKNLLESPVSQAHQVVLGAQGPLLFLCLQTLRLAHTHQAPPDGVTEPEKKRQITRKNQGKQLNLIISSFIGPTGGQVRQPAVLRS